MNSHNDKPSLFGTDGIRDRFGEGYLAAGRVEQIATATAYVLENRGSDLPEGPHAGARTVIVARDTRQSGKELFRIIGERLSEYGYAVKDLGVLPTPAVSYLAATWENVAFGIVLSASHNPAEYNGIKFFSHTGEKMSDAFEAAVTEAFWAGSRLPERDPGLLETAAVDAYQSYLKYLVGCPWQAERLRGRKVVLDSAHGATYHIAPGVFRSLGMEVVTLGNRPDGTNINDGCGALHPERLAAKVRECGADVGFSFDGDGDRMIPVGRNGTIFDGDHVLYLVAKALLSSGQLPSRTVVATLMSNFGLERALGQLGIKLLRTDVGDRHVYASMIAGEHPIGGEQSGHTIFLRDAKTGDGILSALRLLDALESDALDLEGETQDMQRLPQVLKNVRVERKLPFEEFPAVVEAVRQAEAELAGAGRVLLRYSGTEPLARVMVEGEDSALTEALTDAICEAIRTHMA